MTGCPCSTNAAETAIRARLATVTGVERYDRGNTSIISAAERLRQAQPLIASSDTQSFLEWAEAQPNVAV